MTTKFCPSCGREGAFDKYYCVECGDFLVPNLKTIGTDIPTTHPKFTQGDLLPSKKEITFTNPFVQFIKFIFLLSILALLLLIGLAALEPRMKLPPPAPPIATAPFLVSQALLISKNGGHTGLTEQVINSYLRLKGGPDLKPPIDNMPMPKWKASRVVLNSGQVECHLELSLLDHSFFCSEAFHLSGNRSHWTLEPLSGSIGRIPFSGKLLLLLTPLFELYATPLSSELAQIAANGTIQINPGMVVFSR